MASQSLAEALGSDGVDLVLEVMGKNADDLASVQRSIQESLALSAEIERVRGERLASRLVEFLLDREDEDGYVMLTPDMVRSLVELASWSPDGTDIRTMLDAGVGDSHYAELYRTLRGIEAVPGAGGLSESLTDWAEHIGVAPSVSSA